MISRFQARHDVVLTADCLCGQRGKKSRKGERLVLGTQREIR